MIEALFWNMMIIVDLVIAWLVITWVGDLRRADQRINADIAFIQAAKRDQEADALWAMLNEEPPATP